MIYRKSISLCVLLALLAVFGVAVSASGNKDKKKENPKPQRRELLNPPPEIVELKPLPQPIAPPTNGSLFTDDAPGGDLLRDFKPRRVGDLVFVDVVESSEATVSSGAKRNRDSGTVGGLIGAIGALPVPGAGIVGGVVGGLGARKFEGKGSTERRSDLKSRIAARVVEVLPNGDLRIQAEKTVKINKETEQLILTGIVRRSDISAQNSVPTTVVGELHVALNGKGVASADNAPGWLFRLFDKISPF